MKTIIFKSDDDKDNVSIALAAACNYFELERSYSDEEDEFYERITYIAESFNNMIDKLNTIDDVVFDEEDINLLEVASDYLPGDLVELIDESLEIVGGKI